MPPGSTTTVRRADRTAVVSLHGDLVLTSARRVFGELRTLARRKDVRAVELDFADAGRVDSSGLAVISLVSRQLERGGKHLELSHLTAEHEATLALLPSHSTAAPAADAPPGRFEVIGDQVLALASSARALIALIAETLRQTFAVAIRTKRLPAGALAQQLGRMGVDAVFIVGLLSFLLGMTMSFQGAVQLQKFGAGVFVADMVGLTMVREIAPLMTAVILTGRTGAAIAAELGTMRVRSEIDALTTMGISPVRFLVVPRLVAITVMGPALSLLGMFIGIAGGMFVAVFTLGLPLDVFWMRMVDRVGIGDFSHGLLKSLVFAWIIGLAGSHLGLRASGDASGVGTATTRTVVVSIFFIILVDALFATASLISRHG